MFGGCGRFELRRDEVLLDAWGEKLPSSRGEKSPNSSGSSPLPKKRSEDDNGPVKMKWSKDHLHSVFSRFDNDHDGEVDTEQLCPMLVSMDLMPNPELVEQVISSLTRYATISADEWQDFVRAYREKEIQRLRALFDDADTNKGGYLEVDEIQNLITKLGYVQTLQISLEAMAAVDEDNDGKVSFKEFEDFLEHINRMQGFSEEDFNELQLIYRRIAGEGDMQTGDLWRVVVYLGYTTSKAGVDEIACQVDVDSSGTVSFAEMLRTIRRLREDEQTQLVEMLKRRSGLHVRKDMTLPWEDLGIALKEMNYFVSEDAVYEILDLHMGEVEEEGQLTINELTSFLRLYRRTEGFTVAELEELKKAFQQYSKKQSGETVDMQAGIGSLDLGRALRWLGFARTLQQQQVFVQQVDLDGSGLLEFNEFTKLMRQLHSAETKHYLKIIEEYGEDDDSSCIAEVNVEAALADIIGVDPDPQLFAQALKSAKVVKGCGTCSFNKCLSVVKQYKTLALDITRHNCCYSEKEVGQFQKIFNSYDKDGSGSLEKKEMRQMLAEYFPHATQSEEKREELACLIDEVDGDDDGTLDFMEFLHIMRLCDDIRDEEDLALEKETVKEMGMTADDVEGFRSLFAEHTHLWTGELEFEDLVALLEKVVDMDEGRLEDLVLLVQEVHPQGKPVARFPQFLKLIQKITAADMQGINEAASRVLARQARAENDARLGRRISQCTGLAASHTAMSPAASAAKKMLSTSKTLSNLLDPEQ
eukprot:gnl/TRDRNA2_/TRDRNA2_88306_c0_seq1.p1 gnl/TRDRNA2_/TRDRNA2_88306_c0~~gnl/TRDRNA2_/TRDRNA2_88306_c0_seq1.p1  ORF type:complete len:758 (+),score=209.50 gnl/TRDRNA2_/TRDRNA2_88306_c0_seq1:3-2276(+)